MIVAGDKARRLPVNPFEVIVIGGGIAGVAIARECARAGKRVLLLEKNDFGSGTTSRSTRIIHGGLRYLEHAELSLVRESLRERERLLREHPNLVKPLNFILALGEHNQRSRLEIRAGLWLYRQFANPRMRAAGSERDIRQLESSLDSGQRWTLFQYEDAQCEYPERLVAEWLMQAMEAGATALNYCAVLGVSVIHGRARGVIVRDRITGLEQLIESGCIFNATGPWADQICQNSGLDTAGPMIGGVRGTHLVLPRFPGAPDSAIYTQAGDGRKIFVIPWDRQILLGTTEIRDSGDPGEVAPGADEIEYLLRAINRLFPQAELALDDIRYAYAGVRPLPHTGGDSALSAVTRRHILRDHSSDGAAGMFSIIGGKLTTAASLARRCARAIHIHAPEPPAAYVALGDASGVDSTLAHWSQMVARMTGVSQSAAWGMAAWHGRRAFCVAQLARKDALLRQPLCAHTEHIVAEAADAFLHQQALTLGDVLLRRVPIAFAASWTPQCSQEAAERIGKALRWTAAQIECHVEEFEAERNAFLVKPAGRRPSDALLPAENVA